MHLRDLLFKDFQRQEEPCKFNTLFQNMKTTRALNKFKKTLKGWFRTILSLTLNSRPDFTVDKVEV